MTGPVVQMRERCWGCHGDRDMEIEIDYRPVSSGICALLGFTEEHDTRCLHCGRTTPLAFAPGGIEQSQRSATYLAA